MPPANPIHPGKVLLEEFLVPAGRTQSAFAREIGWTRARLWMNLQATHDLDEATRKRRVA